MSVDALWWYLDASVGSARPRSWGMRPNLPEALWPLPVVAIRVMAVGSRVYGTTGSPRFVIVYPSDFSCYDYVSFLRDLQGMLHYISHAPLPSSFGI